MAADVVEVQAAPSGRGLGRRSCCCSTPPSSSSSSWPPTRPPPATPSSSTPRRRRIHLFHEGRLIGPHVLGYSYRLDMETLKRVYEPDPDQAAAAPLLLPRRQVQVLGPVGGQPPSGLPGRGRHPVPHGHRPARPRPVLAHPLRRARLAHRRPDRHRRQLRPRHRAGRHLRLLWRLDRQRHPAPDRDHPLLPDDPLVALALRRPAGHLGPLVGVLRHHPDPGPGRLDRPRPLGPLQGPGPARGGVRPGRPPDGRRARRASSAAT